MITNLSLNDKTQVMILEALKGTEELLRIASGSDNVEITVMTDACPAHNVTRMLDGHFTGTVTKVTDTKEPFVPVGTTVNVCGVVIFKLRCEISVQDFKTRVFSAMEKSPKPYTWNNFNRGNHFVSLMYSNGENIYLVKPLETTKYFPHGFGVEIYDGDIHYTSDRGICIGQKVLYSNVSLSIGTDAFNRAEKTPLETCVQKTLAQNPAKIVV